jgi:hypothetical protein
MRNSGAVGKPSATRSGYKSMMMHITRLHGSGDAAPHLISNAAPADRFCIFSPRLPPRSLRDPQTNASHEA